MYGKEFDGYLFEDAMEETDKLLEGKVAVREEEIEVNRDMNERRRQWSNAGLINFFAELNRQTVICSILGFLPFA